MAIGLGTLDDGRNFIIRIEPRLRGTPHLKSTATVSVFALVTIVSPFLPTFFRNDPPCVNRGRGSMAYPVPSFPRPALSLHSSPFSD